jgi:carboxylesterase
MTAPIIPGAEPWSADGGPHGVLVLHGFTGNPNSMRGLAEAFASAGYAVDLPLLPGHGTALEDMVDTGWADWSACAEERFLALADRCDRVFVAGLSMGGALTAWLATRHADIAGIICINPVVAAPEGMHEAVTAMLDTGAELMDGIGSDIADPDSVESAYPQTPLRPLLTLFDAAAELDDSLGSITCPVLLCTSPQDHVVEPSNSDVLAAAVQGPVERVTLERSYHVATLDFDRDLIVERALAFAARVVTAT